MVYSDITLYSKTSNLTNQYVILYEVNIIYIYIIFVCLDSLIF